MIVVLASQFDDAAKAAVSGSRDSERAVLLTVEDLLAAGWIMPTDNMKEAKFVAEGRAFPVREITGLINLLPGVYDFEMPGIYPKDRGYVAAELFAFLVWWLSVLPCPVLNRPSAGCLNGPSWSLSGWAHACRRAGIPTDTARSASGRSSIHERTKGGEGRSTLVICGRSYGDLYAPECVSLAELAKTEFLEVFFSNIGGGWVFDTVNLLPRLDRSELWKLVHGNLATAQ